jgi:hypothetical protein
MPLHPPILRPLRKPIYDTEPIKTRRGPRMKKLVVGSDGRTDSAHYGGADNPHETIKCLEAWGLERDALLWTSGKYLSRAGKKEGESLLKDLRKALYYLKRRVDKLEASIAAEEKRLKGNIRKLTKELKRKK